MHEPPLSPPAAGAPQPIRHVVLTGLMGAGKTTVGSILADRLGWRLRDSDAEIEKGTGRSVRQLRDEIGVDAMHELEAAHLLESLEREEPAVICAAASVVDLARCRTALRAPGLLVAFLAVSPAVAAGRFGSAAHRPAYGDDPETFLRQQATDRTDRYRSLGALELDADTGSPAELADAVLEAMGGGEAWSSARDATPSR